MEGNIEAPHDIEDPLVASMRHELDGLLPLSASCCIYRVPEELRCVNEKAYTPQAVSIGPIHHGKEGLEDMEEHKKRYLRYFLDRTGVTLEDSVTKIRGKEAELRSCYAHTIGLHSDEFVRVILVDAAFIIELLLRIGNHIVSDSSDRIFHKPWLIKIIVPDMLLLENQLPFFILEDLFATAEVPAYTPSVFDLSYTFCKVSTSLHMQRDDSGSSGFTAEHFVDLIRTLNLPTDQEGGNRGSIETLAVPSMTKLHQVGVKFKARSSSNLFDMRFQDGILEIPNLNISVTTELVLRNLIAFEQCHCIRTTYFSDYVALMDNFVNTPNDVELLVKNGVVESILGDKNVSALINSLGKGTIVYRERFYYATLAKDLNKYYKNPWNKLNLCKKWKANWSTWKAKLKQNYFDTPWTTVSVIAATLLLTLTFIQTVCSISQCAR